MGRDAGDYPSQFYQKVEDDETITITFSEYNQAAWIYGSDNVLIFGFL